MLNRSESQFSPVVTETPLRLPLGGGSTDLPSYYEKHEGFIFGVAIDFYIHVFIKRLRMDSRVQFHYTDCEVAESLAEVKHNIGREALGLTGIDHAISVTFNADSPAGTGLGSSGSYAVGLLNGLYALLGEAKDPRFLAEKAYKITVRIGWKDGKQDPYLAAYGGFTVLQIHKDGYVEVIKPNISEETTERFSHHTTLFYTGIKRAGQSNDILREQDSERVLELKHSTKEIGRKILASFETGDLDSFGLLMDQHWEVKRQMSGKISSDHLDAIYKLGKSNGAFGGKLVGAGGGGYFLFYCPTKGSLYRVRETLTRAGLKPMGFDIDYQGFRIIRLR